MIFKASDNTPTTSVAAVQVHETVPEAETDEDDGTYLKIMLWRIKQEEDVLMKSLSIYFFEFYLILMNFERILFPQYLPSSETHFNPNWCFSYNLIIDFLGPGQENKKARIKNQDRFPMFVTFIQFITLQNVMLAIYSFLTISWAHKWGLGASTPT